MGSMLLCLECPASMDLPSLPENARCFVPDYCSGVTCCLYIKELKTSVEFKFHLDTCAFTLELGIEKLQKKISLIDYEWGEFLNDDVCYRTYINTNQCISLPGLKMVFSICSRKSAKVKVYYHFYTVIRL